MVQIESKAGVENVEKIAQVPGLDVLLIGEFWQWRRCVRGR
jgi:2-keto-3-deoxy-L-rhamnonate aldolase RhmA